jgi:hypothetical protein
MKKAALRTFVAVSFMIVLGATSAYAQSDRRLKGHIPFPFVAGNIRLPAGEYIFQRVNRETNTAPLLIRRVDGRGSVMILVLSSDVDGRQEEAKLVFNRYADLYFLAQVWMPENARLDLTRSRAERELTQNLSDPAPRRRIVALRARR